MSLPYRNSRKKRTPTYILIGDGFDELEVVYFLHRFRQAGLSIKSVSLFDKLVFSRQGVGLKADYQLAENPFDPAQECLLVLPTGGRNGEMLRHDARVRSLLAAFNQGRGCVAVTSSDSDLTVDVERLVTKRPTYQPRTHENLNDFVEALTNRVILA